jgi:hypothetical protein
MPRLSDWPLGVLRGGVSSRVILWPPNLDVPFGRSLPTARPRMFPRKEGVELATKLNRFAIVDEDELLARA